MNDKIKGEICAIVTPFKRDKIDLDSFGKLLDLHMERETDGIVILGTTGESPTVDKEERKELLNFAKEKIKNKMKLIAGVGTNDGKKTLLYSEMALDIGINYHLVVIPYYNKPTQSNLIDYFVFLAKNTGAKIIIYNVPGRTGVNILPETILKIYEKVPENIAGIKEASKNLDQMMDLAKLFKGKISLLSGDDSWTFPLLSLGYEGIISVYSNINPGYLKKMINLFEKGNIEEARKMHFDALPLMNALFIETNPLPVKTLLSYLGWIEEEFRFPLGKMGEENKKKLIDIASKYNLPKANF
ncbi:MAG: 4-hydroxy-tetrahydrodipicolinate synthase [candidate division WOR-3 bacterium]